MIRAILMATMLVAVLAAIALTVRALFRTARRRNTPGWWAAAWISTVLMLVPLVGIVVGLIVLQVDRATSLASTAPRPAS